MEPESKTRGTKWLLFMRFQNNVFSIATWLFVPRLVNQDSKTLPLRVIMASVAASVQGVTGQEGKESDVLTANEMTRFDIKQIAKLLLNPSSIHDIRVHLAAICRRSRATESRSTAARSILWGWGFSSYGNASH